VIINPEIIPDGSNEGLSASKTSSNLIPTILIFFFCILIVLTLKYLFQAVLIFLGLRFIWKLAST
tara:strand:+ start:469 stop:663 length:195 start_codon:yes stop_codon:yes gene_type:complete